jgi:hypothetical protein
VHALVVLAVVLAAPVGPAPLRLQLDQCLDLDQATVKRVVAMELQAALSEERPGNTLTSAKVECSDATVRLTVDDPVTEKTTTRTFDLGGQPRSLRSRLVGLALSEAVLASWIELRLAPAPPPRASEEVAWQETRRAAADIAERRLRVVRPAPPPEPAELWVGPGARWFSSGLHTLGLAVSARRWLDPRASAGVGLELDVGYGRRSVSGVAQAAATSLSLAPALLMRSDFAGFVVMAGAGWRLGVAHLTADPASPLRTGRSATRPWTGPFLALSFSVPLGRSFLLGANLETGYVMAPARGGIAGVEVVALSGSWLGGMICLVAKL